MKNYLVVDLEGTCCNNGSIPPGERETIEIGAVVATTMGISGEFDAFIRPVRHPILTEFCRDLTGIRQDDVDVADEFPAVFARFLHWQNVYEDALFCSWGNYDRDQFHRDCDYHGIQYPFEDHLNLGKMFTQKYGRRRGNRGAAKILGMKPKGRRHRGIDDARNIAAMLPILLEKE